MEEFAPILSELEILPDFTDTVALKQAVQVHVRDRFTKMFGRRLGGCLLLGRTIDVAQPLLMYTVPIGMAQFLLTDRRLLYSERWSLKRFLVTTLAGPAARFSFLPVVGYAFLDSVRHFNAITGPAPLDLTTQRRVMAMVNASGEDHNQALAHDFTIKMVVLVSSSTLLFSRPATNSLWLHWHTGFTGGMNCATVVRSAMSA
jgi:hypothetical protein